MAGFAFHTDLLLKTSAWMPYKVGHEEDLFLWELGLGFALAEPNYHVLTIYSDTLGVNSRIHSCHTQPQHQDHAIRSNVTNTKE